MAATFTVDSRETNSGVMDLLRNLGVVFDVQEMPAADSDGCEEHRAGGGARAEHSTQRDECAHVGRGLLA